MKLEMIPLNELTVKIHHLWAQQWLVLTAGDLVQNEFNSMTVAWGSLGVMWNKPFAQVVVRPQRYTFDFIERYPTFTLCAFPEEYRDALDLLGSRSGRDLDKIKAAGLHPQPASQVAAPLFEEASFVLECRKIYWQDFLPDHFLVPEIARNYPKKDYHRCYFGEILAAAGTDEFLSK